MVFAVAQELLDLLVANPVVLLVVENGNQNVQVRQNLSDALGRGKLNGEVATRRAISHAFVERVLDHRHQVAERLEQSWH